MDIKKKSGFYTIEGALTLTVFTILFLMLISLMQIVLIQMRVQNALNYSAMKVSELAYYSDTVPEISQKISESDLSEIALCEAVSVSEIKNTVNLEQLENLSFVGSKIDFRNDEIHIVASYSVNAETFGLLSKRVDVVQEAHTVLWSTDGERKSRINPNGSIWAAQAFERGKYFVERAKEEFGGESIASGQGLDIFFAEDNAVAEVHSLNIFNESYSKDGIANFDNIYKQIQNYAYDLEMDLRRSEYDSDTTEMWLIMIFPEEAEDNLNFQEVIKEVSSKIQIEENVKMVVKYIEEAYPSEI